MSNLVHNVCKLSQNLFSNFNPITRNGSQNKLDEKTVSSFIKLYSQLTLKDLFIEIDYMNYNFNLKNIAPITYTSVFQNEIFSLTMFGFRRKTSVIPLHDHPSMHGFLKCVYGSLWIKSYTVLNHFEPPQSLMKKIPLNQQSNLVAAKFSGEEIVSSENCKVCMLTPNERNIHEIRPFTSTAVMLDIISPPYTAYTNSYFYTVIDTIYDSNLQQNVTWLLKILESDEYYCDTVPYTGPKIIA